MLQVLWDCIFGIVVVQMYDIFFGLCLNMLNIEVCNFWKIVYLYYRVFCIVYLRKDDFFQVIEG